MLFVKKGYKSSQSSHQWFFNSYQWHNSQNANFFITLCLKHLCSMNITKDIHFTTSFTYNTKIKMIGKILWMMVNWQLASNVYYFLFPFFCFLQIHRKKTKIITKVTIISAKMCGLSIVYVYVVCLSYTSTIFPWNFS